MERRAGASCLLSVLIVGVAAVVLYRPDAPPAVQAEMDSPAVEPSAVEPRPRPIPEPTPGVSWNEAADHPRPVQTAAVTNAPVRPAATRRTIQRQAPSSFTTVRPGETLADVARRVYGDESAASSLWQANRDQLDDGDDPLRPGTPLRTPDVVVGR
jgi:nucleoid-associated protein YgaU